MINATAASRSLERATEIRRAYAAGEGSFRALGQRFELSESMVSLIVSEKRCPLVPRPRRPTVVTDELRARRALGGRIGAARTRSLYSPQEQTAAARAAFRERFTPANASDLDPAEVEARIRAGIRAFMLRISLKSAQIRNAKRTARIAGNNGEKGQRNDGRH